MNQSINWASERTVKLSPVFTVFSGLIKQSIAVEHQKIIVLRKNLNVFWNFRALLLFAPFFAQSYCAATMIQLKRLDVLSRSPMVSMLQESMSGSNIIAATQQTERFIVEYHRKIDHLTSVLHCSHASLQYGFFPNLPSIDGRGVHNK